MPARKRFRFGAHAHEQAKLDIIRLLANQGLLSGLTVINNALFANEMAQRHIPTVFRMVRTGYDPNPEMHGNDGDRALAEKRFDDFGLLAVLDPKVYIQVANEQNYEHDNIFYLHLMQYADQHGRKVSIFNDSVGSDATFRPSPPTSAMWRERQPARQYARDHGHMVSLHTYGVIDANYHPVSAYDNPGDWPWWGGRFRYFYDSDPTCQPPLMITECGPGKAEQQTQHGFDAFWKDVTSFMAQTSDLDYLVSANWWDFGGGGPYGFEGAQVDDFGPLMAGAYKQTYG